MRLLTIEALDKIRETMNLLLEYGQIEWQGSLRETYNKYFHPNTLEYNNPEMWAKLGDGEVIDLFQFNTEIGMQTAKKVKPLNLLETAVANSLMRLMSDGGDIQPVDQYVKYKNDISLWYQEMKDHDLSDEDIHVMEKYLKDIYGVADTQEVVMQMVMDEKVAAFDVALSNKLRKAIAKKSEKDMKEVRGIFFKMGEALGAKNALLNYIWNVQIKRQEGYSFSLLHTLAYSLIALQELNIYFKYDPLFWNTAVLTVNAASTEEEDDDEDEERKTKSTNYGKVAAAIGMMQSHGVKIGLPDINKAAFGFKPDLVSREIIYGLKGLVGIGDELASTIVNNRPYESFEDFLLKLHDTGSVKKSHVLQLIKAGCFDAFDNRVNLMSHFIKTRVVEPKERLTMQNFNSLIENSLIPTELSFYQRLYKYKKYISNKTYKVEGKDKQFLLDNIATEFFYEHFSDKPIVGYSNNYPIISEKLFKKEYDKHMDGIKEWLQNPKTLEIVNQKLFENAWEECAEGSISKWEMESLSFYYNEHELSHVNADLYGITNFNVLPEEPEVAEYYEMKGIKKPKFKLACIAGTVLDRNKNKHTVTLLTPHGVVMVKYYDGQFAHYNKQVSKSKSDGSKEILEKSWFTRGNKLLISGYRRGSQFKAHRYFETKMRHTTMLITKVNNDGTLQLRSDRVNVERENPNG